MEARPDDVRTQLGRLGFALTLALIASGCSGSDPDKPDAGQPGGGAGVGSGGGGAASQGGGAAGMAGASAAGTASAGSAVGGGAPGGAGGTASAGQGGSAVVMAGAGGGAVAGSGGAPESVAYPPSASGGDVAAGVQQLNRYRATLGLSQVTLDAASSPGCEGHLQYLIEEAELRGQQGYLEHTESNRENSHYSPENEAAGKASDLAWGQSRGPSGTTGQSLAEAVDLWINGVYHRTPLLNPGLVKVGAASIQGYNCLNYNATGNTTVLKIDRPVLWPANGMTDVPRAFGGNEGPCPTNADPLAGGRCNGSGFIISANYYNWGTNRASAITSVASVTLTNTMTQAPVSLFTWYADGVAGHDPARGYMRDQIALVPQAALDANTTYRVDVDGVVNGTAAPLSWTFTTGSRNE